MPDSPRVTRAPEGVMCLCGDEPADRRLETAGGSIIYCGPSCRAALAQPLPRREFEAVDKNGERVRIRVGGAPGTVEYDYSFGKMPWATDDLSNLVDWRTPSCLRAIASALEEGGAR